MSISDLLSIAAVVAGVNVVLGYWAKSRIEGSIKHEYDRRLEQVKSEAKRTDVLLSERLAVFKLLQKRLVSLKRYCKAHVNSQVEGEFGTHVRDLDAADNKALLAHWTEIEALFDDNQIYVSPPCRASFERLSHQLSLGASMEVWLASPDPAPEVVASQADGYLATSAVADECIDSLFKDLGFPRAT